jgi:hypothetical protein
MLFCTFKCTGFTLDSLLKLQSAKAFDRKTSVLQYVVTLIFRNDPDCLRFPEDLAHISEASRLTLDAVSALFLLLPGVTTDSMCVLE